MSTKRLALPAFAALALLVFGFAATGAAQLVQVTSADPACVDTSGNRFVDCGNGTVTDNTTSLVWLQDAGCYGGVPAADWFEVMGMTEGLSDGHCGLTDGSAPGDWRLPTKEEWETMIAGVPVNCDPRIFNDAGTDCWTDGVDSFVSVVSERYWSPTTNVDNVDRAWFVDLTLGVIDEGNKIGDLLIWPVRSSQ